MKRPGLCYITTLYSTVNTVPDILYLDTDTTAHTFKISPCQHIQSYLSVRFKKRIIKKKKRNYKNAKTQPRIQ